MKLLQNNHAYIDAANLHHGVKSLGWKLDYTKLRIWLTEKFCVTHAYMFIGYLRDHADIYSKLRQLGYTLIFKETVSISHEHIKGNCDADLVLKVVCDTYENAYDEAVIISSDGDYASLIKFLKLGKRLRMVISPSNRCSSLITRLDVPLTYLGKTQSTVDKLSLK